MYLSLETYLNYCTVVKHVNSDVIFLSKEFVEDGKELHPTNFCGSISTWAHTTWSQCYSNLPKDVSPMLCFPCA